MYINTKALQVWIRDEYSTRHAFTRVVTEEETTGLGHPDI